MRKKPNRINKASNNSIGLNNSKMRIHNRRNRQRRILENINIKINRENLKTYLKIRSLIR